MRRTLPAVCLAAVALILTACGGNPPPKQAPARDCAGDWNRVAPAAYRRQLDAAVTRDGYRRVLVVRSFSGTALARLGRCFVVHARVQAHRNHVFIEDGRGRWRVVNPPKPSGRPAPTLLPNLVRRAFKFPNAKVGPDGRLTIKRRDAA